MRERELKRGKGGRGGKSDGEGGREGGRESSSEEKLFVINMCIE